MKSEKKYPGRTIKRKKGTTDPSKMYFNPDTQDAIVTYASLMGDCTKARTRNEIYNERIAPAFRTLVDNLVNVHKFSPVLQSTEELKNDCVHFLFEAIPKFDASKGTTAFSYFNIVAKNWLIGNTKNKGEKMKRIVSVSEPESLSNSDRERILEFETLDQDQFFDFSEENASEKIVDFFFEISENFKAEEERQAIIAMARLFQYQDDIELINKTLVFQQIRSMSGISKKQLSALLQKLRKDYKQIREYVLDI